MLVKCIKDEAVDAYSSGLPRPDLSLNLHAVRASENRPSPILSNHFASDEHVKTSVSLVSLFSAKSHIS